MTVENVFERYCAGDTFNQIADSLTECAVAYSDNDFTWNKNNIARMIDDVRYLGNEEYPRIVSAELFAKARGCREERSAKKAELSPRVKLIKDKLVCGRCGGAFSRKNKWRTREKWMCANGCKCAIYLDDQTIIGANVRWGIRQSMKSGTYCTNFSCFGYRRGDDGIPVIVPEEAETVRTIFGLFLDGKSILMICRYLAENHIKTFTGKSEWNQRTVRDLITNEKYVGDLLLQKTYIEDTVSKKSKKNNGELAKYLISNNHPAIIDRDTFNIAQAELAGRTSKRKKSERGITEQGKYSGKYALTDVLVCGCCGSHYRRTGKTVNGIVQHVWRCIGRIEHRCKDAAGLEENKLHAAICRCISGVLESREEVVNLCRTNLQYALTGDDKLLDAYALENQIRVHQEEIDILMEQAESTQGNPEKYENAIVGLYDKIRILREQLHLAKEQTRNNADIQAEIERFMIAIQEYSADSFTDYDDTIVRRLVECIKVMPDRTIEVILKGGVHGKEKVC